MQHEIRGRLLEAVTEAFKNAEPIPDEPLLKDWAEDFGDALEEVVKEMFEEFREEVKMLIRDRKS